MKRLLYLMVILLVPALVFGAAFLVYKVPFDAESADSYLLKGNMFYRQGYLEKAQENYEKAIMIDPEFEEALNNLAYIYNKFGDYKKALETLKSLTQIDPENPQYHYDYAVNLVLKIKEDNAGTIEEIEAAIAEFKKTAETNPDFLRVKENLAFLENIKDQYYGE